MVRIQCGWREGPGPVTRSKLDISSVVSEKVFIQNVVRRQYFSFGMYGMGFLAGILPVCSFNS